MVNLRSDYPSLLVTLLLPSVLLYLSSTNSGSSIASSNSPTKLIPCKIDNFLYCNYPMTFDVVSEFREDFNNDINSIQTTLIEATNNVAEILGMTFDELFPNPMDDPTSKNAGDVRVLSNTTASVVWYNGVNNAFAQNFVNLMNQELVKAGNPIQFEELDNPYEYEMDIGFDLRVGSFLLLLQSVGGHITSETSSNLYLFFSRAGMRPSAFWMFQYLYWMAVASLTIGFTTIFGEIIGESIQANAYFIAGWFHIAFAVFLASIFKNKKIVNMASFSLLGLGIVVPVIFAVIKPSEKNQNIYNVFKFIPIFFFTGNVTNLEMIGGCVISVTMMVLGAYFVPIFAGVGDGMYTGSRVNYFYFLTSQFWQNGIVAMPSYGMVDNADTLSNNGGRLVFLNCVKRFGDKVIGPLNVSLQHGTITTLLGPNGVGKSTLMRVAAGYYIPDQGEMLLNGTNLFRESPHVCLKSISFCPQDNYLYENMTVQEHLQLMTFFRDMSQIDDTSAHIDWILHTLGIFEKKSTKAKHLSGGMKRRLCLAISTLGFPPVILCDEPSSGVDSISQRGIWKLLETMKKKSAILLTSHSTLETMILSDLVIRMQSSENITQTLPIQGIAFSIKDETDNIMTEYDVNDVNWDEVANIIVSLPNDGIQWKVTSKHLTDSALPSLEEAFRYGGDNNAEDTSESRTDAVTTTEIPETLNCEAPSTHRQIMIMISTVIFHVDRMFFLVTYSIPINGAQIWLLTNYEEWDGAAQLILTPLLPLIAFIAVTIIMVQVTDLFATERSLGVSKLILSQGITRFAYLFSSVLIYSILSYPVSLSLLLGTGSLYGTSSGMLAIFIIYSSFFFLVVGICCGLGALLDTRTAFVMTLVLPSLFAIFAQGSISPTFTDSYPGGVGQVISGLIINDVDKTEWNIFSISIVANFLLGSFGFYAFMVKLGNYNPSFNLFSKSKADVKMYDDEDIDDENPTGQGGEILLEGKGLEKVYGVGKKDSVLFKALDNVTFTVRKGSLLGLVGKSGAGKSTLMDILAGQLSASSGAVYVEGVQVAPADISKVVSMCSQLDTVWPKIKVRNAIAIFMLCRGYKGNLYCSRNISDPYIEYLIKELGLQETLNSNVDKLSGGQKRRLAFLISLVGNTKVVLVDEAMTGVDIESRQIMWKILQDEVRLRDRSVVVTSHEMSEVEQYCNNIGILHKGKLVEIGHLDDIKKKWSDSIKLVCLLSSHDAVSNLKNILAKHQPCIVVEDPEVDILDESNLTRIIAVYSINLISVKNITGLISTMNQEASNPSILYWSVEPQSLDDFVRTMSKMPSLVVAGLS